ncbi:MAG: signal peptidase I [Candidatus Yanofskybacteria bacterium]|nr:signal peptidase I [Candidatus Yanofskybacteria bacterium]
MTVPEEIKADFQNKDFSERKELLSFFWEVIRIVVISVAIIVPVRYFLVQPFFVRGASMESLFEDGDYLLIDEISYRFRQPQRGEVIVFRAPEDKSQFYIKRIIGLPGEEVQIKDGEITILNKENPKGLDLDESLYLDKGVKTIGNLNISIGPGEYFVLGDNREHSSDSRIWGQVNKKLITGRAFFRAWPFDKVTKFKEVVY